MRDRYSDEQYALLKSLESTASVEMIYNILQFLDASPLTVFLGAGWDDFRDDMKNSFIAYLIHKDERLRYLTSAVSRKMMVEGSTANWRANQNRATNDFKSKFWISR